MVPKHDGARPRIPGVSATVFPVQKEKRKRIPYPCMLPKTWSTTGVPTSVYPIKREEQEPLPLPDYFFPITGGIKRKERRSERIKKNFAKKKKSDGTDLSNSVVGTNSPTKTNIDGNKNFLKDGASIIEFKKGTMEEIIFGHPKLGKKIFKELDDCSLVQCREVNRSLKNFVEAQTFYNLRLIKSLTNCSDVSLIKILQKSNADFVIEFGSNVLNDCGKFLKKSREIDPDSSIHEILFGEHCDGWTILHEAAKNGHLEVFQLVTENFRVEINAPNYCRGGSESEYYSDESNKYEDKWWMPSHLRDEFGSGLRIKKTKSYKDDASSQKGQTPLHLAAKNGHLSMCRWIMENKADTDIEPVDYHGKTPLHVAAEHGHLEICKLIVQNMQDTKSKKNDHVKAKDKSYSDYEDDSEFDEKPHPLTPIHLAASNGHLKIVELFMETMDNKNPGILHIGGFDGDVVCKTPLHLAAENGHQGICELILQNIDEIPVAPDDTDEYFSNDVTPFQLAAQNNHLSTCKAIIDNYEDKNPEECDGQTLLHWAAENGYFSVCELIMENIEDKNPQNGSGQTPLHLAAMEGHFEVCQLLLENTIDRNPKDFDDKTPLDLAIENNHQKVCDLIEQSLKDASSEDWSSQDSETDSEDDFEVDSKDDHESHPKDYSEYLVLAVENGDLPLCKLSLVGIENEKSAALHLAVEKGHSANCEMILRLAAAYGYISICKILLENKTASLQNCQVAGCKLMPQNIDGPDDKDGHIPFQLAAQNNHLSVCQVIFDTFEDKNPKVSNGQTMLHWAAEFGYLHVFIMIMENILDKNPEDDDRQTPLHLAAKNGHLEVCQLILENTSEKNPKDGDGVTPLQLATEQGEMSLIKLFRSFKKKILLSRLYISHFFFFMKQLSLGP